MIELIINYLISLDPEIVQSYLSLGIALGAMFVLSLAMFVLLKRS